MAIKQKTHIKHLFAYCQSKKQMAVDIAVLTDSNQYVEYSLEFRQAALTKYVSRRIRSLFEPYAIDKNTDIAVNEVLGDWHPLYLYFMNLHQHIGFRLQATTLDRIINRVHYFYFKKTAAKPKFSKTWQQVIESKQCPWITQDIEYAIQNKGPSIARRIRTSRLAMFYLVIKNHLCRVVKKSKQRHLDAKPMDV